MTDNESGILSAFLYITLLIFVGVGLSFLVDRGLRNRSLATKIEENLLILEEEKDVLQRLQGDLAKRRKTISALADRLAARQAESHELRKSIETAQAELAAPYSNKMDLCSQYSAYVQEYKIFAWDRARGEKMSYIMLKSGLKFDEVEIDCVDEKGLQVSHSTGVAHLPIDQLTLALKNRFQWHFDGPSDH